MCVTFGFFDLVFTTRPCLTYTCEVNDCGECGYIVSQAERTNNVKLKSRIINGKPTKYVHPWMAGIIRGSKKRKRGNRPNEVQSFYGVSTGAIKS